MQTLHEIKALLESRGFSPRHALGQNFLLDHNLIRKLVDSAALAPGELVVEVGPGTGTLTEELLARVGGVGGRVVACELDRGLAQLLRERHGSNPSFTLIEGDCLEGKSAIHAALAREVEAKPFVLVANLPYGAATPLMLTLLIDYPLCRGLFVTIQKEVADRLLAAPRTKDYGPLSIVAQSLARIEKIATLPPECFWPRPDITSAMVALTRLAHPLTSDPRGLSEFCTMAFSKRRKQLGSILGRQTAFPDGVRPESRIEELSPAQVVALARVAR